MKKEYAFYITNHGFGHASRNARIIQGILEKEPDSVIHIKTDSPRCKFLRKNLKKYEGRILYYSDVSEVGFLLMGEKLEVDVQRMKSLIEEDLKRWHEYIAHEEKFLAERQISVVISDIIPWVLIAADKKKIPSVLLCNFTWFEMYSDFLPQDLCQPYLEAYQKAKKVFIYEFGAEVLDGFFKNAERVSFVSRRTKEGHINEIRERYVHPIVFVSVGKSIEMTEKFDASNFSGTVLATAGVELTGKNVVHLSPDLIATQDYIAASDYVITKSGWATLGEVFLNRKRAAVIARGENSEDRAVIHAITKDQTAIPITFEELNNIPIIIQRLDKLEIGRLKKYHDDAEIIINYIVNKVSENYEEKN